MEEEVGRTRVVSLGVVERRRGMSSRPMLPEAEVMRIDLGGMVAFYLFFLWWWWFQVWFVRLMDLEDVVKKAVAFESQWCLV